MKNTSKYKVGDIVTCEVELQKNNKKHIVSTEKEIDQKNVVEQDFQIVQVNEIADSGWYSYMIVISDDILGWTISKFHVEVAGVAKAFLGKKFWELNEDFIIKKAEHKNDSKSTGTSIPESKPVDGAKST